MIPSETQMAYIICEISENCVHRKRGKPANCGDCRIPARLIDGLIHGYKLDEGDLEQSETAAALASS